MRPINRVSFKLNTIKELKWRKILKKNFPRLRLVCLFLSFLFLFLAVNDSNQLNDS